MLTHVRKMAIAEVRYSASTLAAWTAVLLVTSLWPFVESLSVTTIPSVLAFAAIVLPVVTSITTFRFLTLERSESRLRLFGTLPVGPAAVGLARQLRACALPILALLFGAALILVGVAFEGLQFLAAVDGAWVLPFLLLLSVAAAIFATLLYDVGGMTFTQLVTAGLIAAAFLENSYGPGLTGSLVERVSEVAQTPTGLVGVVFLCVLLAAADIALLAWRPRH